MLLPYTIYPDTHPVLRQPTVDVLESELEEVKAIVNRMKVTLEFYGGLGLACPQVGILKNVIIAKPDTRRNSYIIMLNPRIVLRSVDSETKIEGCLSLDRRVFDVKRSKSITVSYKDINFKEKQDAFIGWKARILSHEIDHLNQILISDIGISIKNT